MLLSDDETEIEMLGSIDTYIYNGFSEYLPFRDIQFETIISISEIEFCIDISFLLSELLRVGNTVILGYRTGKYSLHQTLSFESNLDVIEQILKINTEVTIFPIMNEYEFNIIKIVRKDIQKMKTIVS